MKKSEKLKVMIKDVIEKVTEGGEAELKAQCHRLKAEGIIAGMNVGDSVQIEKMKHNTEEGNALRFEWLAGQLLKIVESGSESGSFEGVNINGWLNIATDELKRFS